MSSCVITGVGVVAPNGMGKIEYWRNCLDGVAGIRPISLFDSAAYTCKYAGEVANISSVEVLGQKGLRNLDRTTQLVLVASKMAMDDAKLTTDLPREDIGVVLGSTMGSVHSISEFDKEGLREGPRFVNPSHFPNTVINSPASQVAIRFGLRGLNTTISTGFTAGLDALGYAMDMLTLGRIPILVVGGVEELCLQTFLGFYRAGLLLSTNGSIPKLSRNGQARGTLLGEGAAVIVVETAESAAVRNAPIYASVLGYSSGFHAASHYKYDKQGRSIVESISCALSESDTAVDEIDLIFVGSHSGDFGYESEMAAINTIFGNRQVATYSIKALLGETFSAGGAFQIAAALGVLSYQKPAAQSLDPLIKRSSPKKILIHAFGPIGISSAVVLAVPNH